MIAGHRAGRSTVRPTTPSAIGDPESIGAAGPTTQRASAPGGGDGPDVDAGNGVGRDAGTGSGRARDRMRGLIRAARITGLAGAAATLAVLASVAALAMLEGRSAAVGTVASNDAGILLAALRALAVAVAGVAASLVDLRERRIPNAITVPAASAVAASAAVESAWRAALIAFAPDGHADAADPLAIVAALAPLGLVLLGAATAGLPFALLAWFGTMGMGDVKLAALLGAALLPTFGWPALATAAVAAYVLALPHALAALIRRRRHPEAPRDLPFGPYLVAGAIAAAIAASTGVR